MYIDGLPEPVFGLFSSNSHVPRLLYYTHIPVILVSLVMGIYIYFRSGGKLASKVVLMQFLVISIWCLMNIISWIDINTDRLMFISSLFAPFGLSIFIFGLLFIIVLSGKKTNSFLFNSVIIAILLFLILWVTSKHGIFVFNLISVSVLIPLFPMGFFYGISFLILLYAWRYVLKFAKNKNSHRNGVTIIGLSFIICLTIFNCFSIASAYFAIKGVDLNFTLESYGMLAMPVYMATIAFCMAKFNTMGIKINETKFLVVTIIILVGSQLLFIQNNEDRLFTAATLVVCAILGYFLLHIIQSEENNKRRSLEKMNRILNQKNLEVEKANKELQKLDNAKTEFINIASHQLRSPLTIVKGVASLLISGKIDKFSEKDKKNFYNSVWSKCLKLENIIDDILNAAAFTNNKFSMMNRAAEKVDLYVLIHKILDEMRYEIETRDLDIKVKLENADNHIISAQKEYIEEALVNLITNAIKYTPSTQKTDDIREARQEKGKIEISIGIDKSSMSNILITIKDNGIGVPKEEISHLFRRFYRAENARRMYTDGTGLGLFIVREIVEGHGGKIWIESLEDKGTTFYVSLPIKPIKEPDFKEYIIEQSVPPAKFSHNK